nr:SDR family NAD(P)-dependent oxidoreductase [Candidatus Dormibacteraeota bacterium]
VDTVKQAEIFAEVRERYGIARDDTRKLRDFPTIAHVARFIVENGAREVASTAGTTAAPALDEERVEPSTPIVAADCSAADRVPRRVPVLVPRPPLDLCAATGVSLDAGARVLLVADKGGVADALAGRLHDLGATPIVVEPAGDTASFDQSLRAGFAGGPITGIYWLPALDVEPALDDLDLEAWREGLRLRVKLLYTTMRTLAGIGAPGTFLVSASRLGGRHGYNDSGASAPMGGSVTGFTKAFARERPDALVKAVDHGADATAAEIAEHLVAETHADPGVVEVGHALGARWTITLEERPAVDERPGLQLGRQSVIVITGAAGGIVSAITADLAASSGATFHLLDLTPAPSADDSDITRFSTDRKGLKRDLADRLRVAGEKVTPVAVGRRLAAVERQAAALAAIQAVEAAGGRAVYHSVDLTDGGAVAATIERIREKHTRIDVLMHAAGIEISHMLADKEPREFDLVFDVKADGLFNLLRATSDMPVGALVVFSSVAGRFGNAGQTDYSAANDLLCKMCSSLRSTHPETRAIAVDWTAWAGIGMATRGSIPKMMKLAGIDMLSPEVGVPTIRRELTAGATRGEVVVAGALGVLGDDRAPAGGVDPHATPIGSGPMMAHVVSVTNNGVIATEATLDPSLQPFLDHHRVDGVALLPGVMGIDTFAEAAQAVLPGWYVTAVENVDFKVPFKFYRDQPRTIHVEVAYRTDGDEAIADCRLIGSRVLTGQSEPQVTEHFTGRVLLSKVAPESGRAAPPFDPPATAVAAADIYRVYFHGPAYQVLDAAWAAGGSVLGRMSSHLPADVGMNSGATINGPRLGELCFQTAGAWELGTTGVLAFPAHVESVSFFGQSQAPVGTVYAVVNPAGTDGGFDAEVVDASGTVMMRMRGYRTIPAPMSVADGLLAPFRGAMA